MSDERVPDPGTTPGETPGREDAHPSRAAEADGAPGASEDGLLDRVELIEAQPLAQRAAGFEQLHDELLAELQRSDQTGSGHGAPAPQGNGA